MIGFVIVYFHIYCTSQGKIYDVIIDNKNYENDISKNIVGKIKLDTKNYPYSYKLKWLHTKIEMKVNKRCLVEFLFSKNYKDIIMCDVHINVCHLLFGQPWQYYTRVICDGYKKTYCFVKDREKIILDSFKIKSHFKPFQT
jgi:hypothetical protein